MLKIIGRKIMKHNYFGKIEKGWSGFSSEFKFKIPYFDKETEIFLGLEWDDDGEEIEVPPNENELNEYENTLRNFLEKIDEVVDLIKEGAFEYYNKIYAKYYENEFIVDSFFETNRQNGEKHEPLNIKTKELHFSYMKDLNYIRILKNNRIVLPIFYKLDSEHNIEILLKDNKLIMITGMGENFI
jgi:hypothetical protein